MAICKYCCKEYNNNSIGGHVTQCEKNPKHDSIKRNQTIRIINGANTRYKNLKALRHDYIFKCLTCGKEFCLNLTENEYNSKKYKTHCSNSCANSRKEINKNKTKIVSCKVCNCKEEVSIHVSNSYLCKNCKIEKYKKDALKHNTNLYNEFNNTKYEIFDSFKCIVCGKDINPSIKNNFKYYERFYCSDECESKYRSFVMKCAHKLAKEEGRNMSWKSRNIISYAERFWIQVLNNNNIQYQKEFYLDKKYFLDFLIEKNNQKIDLEIDGKQHTYQERIEHDKERDEYVTNAGYIVYRIPWNSISSEKGSLEMKEKIDKFLEFYNSL